MMRALAARPRRGPSYTSVTLAFLALAAICLHAADLHVTALDPWADLARFIAGFFRPDFAAVGARAVVLTVAFAVAGVSLGSVAGLALSLIFARSRTVRLVAAGARSIHELFWALILMQVTGLSATTGVLAVAIPYAGIFAKVYAEIMEEADLSAERVLPARTGIVSRFLFVRAPLLSHAFRSYLLYRLECGMRSTLILGFIGVPTIGFSLETFFNQGDYPQVAALILAFYGLIATRGLWARPVTLPFLIAGSLVALWLLVDGLTGAPVSERLVRFFAGIVPAPLRATGHGSFGAWLWHLLREQVGPGLVATLVLSQLAATLSAASSLLLFPAISRSFTGRFGRIGGRAFLIVLRGTPEFVAVYILLQLLGPSLLPAVIALGLHNGGIIGFLMGRHADAITYRRDAPRRLNLYAYETVPRLYGQFMALVLYRYEIIVRESAIVGILGVRTLGFYVTAGFYEFKFDEALLVLIATAALSMAIDATSRVVRRRLRIDQLPTRLAGSRGDQSAAAAAG